ncbi:YiiX family permuted papain-like enzyme [Budviciaceae bacterium CWB-B4]|uniref:YiiX family permuted papain-like enzyme n=1 Tax=Limnobaculum xujianqingii TaxID=2738837 RepID=A0A9D7AGK0_9GAMM|nr:YiiX family permuted papain-like enzyme [Limnobaculum xujianqingii]MBK5072385.1 YiiX family permuted papain-like enzyme [Limnobaculum xujianqingii]MBK5175694.1 YiiX family permuted papain-like enzyme [Limnobaculum xujianqingii]
MTRTRLPILLTALAIIIVASLFIFLPKSYGYQPQSGDIIFHTSRSSQSQAIQLATHSPYSHMGIILFKNKKPYVYEASKRVQYTPLNQWIERGTNGKYVIKRLKQPLTVEQQQQIQKTAQRYANAPYDLSFSWSDERLYCSELVWKIYFNALGMKIGNLQKLREFDLTSSPVKKKLAERYGSSIPLDETVISPDAIFDSPLLTLVGKK